MINKTIRMTESLINRTEKAADDTGVDFSEFVRIALEEKLSRKKSDDNDILRLFMGVSSSNPHKYALSA